MGGVGRLEYLLQLIEEELTAVLKTTHMYSNESFWTELSLSLLFTFLAYLSCPLLARPQEV